MYLSGLANKLELQLLAWSCHGQRVQKFEVSSTGSLAVLNSRFQNLYVEARHSLTNVDDEAQIGHMNSHTATVRAYKDL